MGFVLQNVGALGANRPEDVKVVQWLLDKANIGYCFTTCTVITPKPINLRIPNNLKDSYSSNIEASGAVNAVTQKAIDDFAAYCYRQKFISARVAGIQSLNTTISGEDDLYNRLVWATVHTYAPKFIASADDYNDPRIKQALNGRINFIQFQTILEQSRQMGLTELGKQMQRHLNDPKVIAFLDMIARAESWFYDPVNAPKREVGYNEAVGYVKLANLYGHPGRVAGRYQFTTDTWNRARRECGLYDFTQESQDIAGVYLLATLPTSTNSSPYPQNDRILPFVLAGTPEAIEYAIELASGTWASFPTKYEKDKKDGKWILKANFDRNGKDESRYSPQHSAPLNELLALYNNFLGNK
jgi:muramidase (phage lysozyme)